MTHSIFNAYYLHNTCDISVATTLASVAYEIGSLMFSNDALTRELFPKDLSPLSIIDNNFRNTNKQAREFVCVLLRATVPTIILIVIERQGINSIITVL